MNILFICSSLSPGKDGVGDYTLKLAQECNALGCQYRIIALNDIHLGSKPHTVDNKILRLSSGVTWPERLPIIKTFLSDFRPDICSWQIVSYGFDPKGILPRQMLRFAREFQIGPAQIMLHEVWIGVSTGSRLRDILTGWIQKKRLIDFVRTLKPVCVHTSNPTYQTLLSANRVSSKILPLFGNITIAEKPLPPAELASPTGGEIALLPILIFGTIHPQWNPMPFIQWLEALARRKGLKPLILAAGRLGPHAPEVLEQLRKAQLPVLEVGEQSQERISCFLQYSAFGLVLHPWALVGKSGVAAAFLDHGLPTLVPRDEWELRGDQTSGATNTQDPLLLRLSEATVERTDTWLAARRTPQPSGPRIAKQFLDDLRCSRQ